MGTFFFGKTIGISAAISASGGAGTLYTAPADKYAIVQVTNLNGTPSNFSVGAFSVSLAASGAGTGFMTSVYIGPGQSFSVSSGSIGISGVEFENTP